MSDSFIQATRILNVGAAIAREKLELARTVVMAVPIIQALNNLTTGPCHRAL
jgi:hypothetical protein